MYKIGGIAYIIVTYNLDIINHSISICKSLS
jgi:hypothetical protein